MGVRMMGRSVLCVGLAAALFGCSCDEGDADPGGGDATVSPDGTTGTDATVVGPTCSTDAECDPEVCHPFSMTCVSAGDACGAQSECSGGSYCDQSRGVCLPGTPGSPCETADNCENGCQNMTCGCDGLAQEAQLESGPLDIYLVFDRTGSMGDPCEYDPNGSPPGRADKACYAVWALTEYLSTVMPQVDTRLAFQFMSLPNDDDCDGTLYETPLVPLTSLPVSLDHEIIQAIDSENFRGGEGTDIESALRGISAFTAANKTDGREMIGVLLTDGDPSEDCDVRRADALAQIIGEAEHKIFIIGMDGATEQNLETMAEAGGAEPHQDYCGDIGPPCHYWNVGDGSGDALKDALQAIVGQAIPIPCEIDITGLQAPAGETLDYGKINVTFTAGSNVETIGQVPGASDCPGDQPAWYYNNSGAPTTINLCQNACDQVSSAGAGARVDIVVGCNETVTVPLR